MSSVTYIGASSMFFLSRILLRFDSFNFNFIYFYLNFVALLADRRYSFTCFPLIKFDWMSCVQCRCKTYCFEPHFIRALVLAGESFPSSKWNENSKKKNEIPFTEGFGQQCIVTKSKWLRQTNVNKQNECVIKFVDLCSEPLYFLFLSVLAPALFLYLVRVYILLAGPQSLGCQRLFISCVLSINFCRFQINAYTQSAMWIHVKSIVDFIYFRFYDRAIRSRLTFRPLVISFVRHR